MSQHDEIAKSLQLASQHRGLTAAQRPIPNQLPHHERHSLRKLPFEQAHNFRDLGGYKNRDGQQLKWGMIYRTDKLSSLSEEDQRYLQRLEVKRIVDFRSDEERLSAPHALASGYAVRVDAMPITVDAAQIELVTARLQQEDVSADDMAAFLVDANREMVVRYTPVYRQWMHSLLEQDHYPQLFHCTAGKDRTGLAAALLLHALDVPEDTIMEDYLATNHYTAERIDQVIEQIVQMDMLTTDEAVIRTLFHVQPQFINAAFEAIDEHYGSLADYFEHGLKLDALARQQLRELLLEDG